MTGPARVRLYTLFTLFLAGSALAAPAGAPASAAPPTQVAEFFAAIKAANRVKVEAMLARAPALAAAHGPKGASAVLTAALMLRTDAEGFVCTRKNPVLSAVLARAPAPDVFEAALVGDVARLSALLAADPGLIAARHQIGWTPLHFASFGGKLDTVKLLLDRGAEIDPRARNRFQNTPLQTASLCGERDVMAHLLDRGADPNVRQGEGFASLHDAAFLGRIDIIQLLLDHGADINARGDTGESPLGLAVRVKMDKAAAYLREKGAKQ